MELRGEAPPELRPGGALLLVLIHFSGLMTVYILGAWSARDDIVNPLWLAAASVTGPLIALYVGLNRYAHDTPTLEALRLGWPRARAWAVLPLALTAGAALSPVGNDLTLRLVTAFPVRMAPEQWVIPTGVEWWSAILTAAVLAPFVEETLFRGFLLPRVARTVGPGRAWLVVTALYTAAQLNPRFMPAAFLVSASTAVVALASGNTWVPVMTHVGYQLLPLVLDGTPWRFAVLHDAQPQFLPVLTVLGCSGLAALALGLAWVIRDPRGR